MDDLPDHYRAKQASAAAQPLAATGCTVECDDYGRPRRITDRFGAVYECTRKLEQPGTQGPTIQEITDQALRAHGYTDKAGPTPDIAPKLQAITSRDEIMDAIAILEAKVEAWSESDNDVFAKLVGALDKLQQTVTPAYVQPPSFTLAQQAAKWAYEQASYHGRNGQVSLSARQVDELAQRLYRFAMDPEANPLHKAGDSTK